MAVVLSCRRSFMQVAACLFVLGVLHACKGNEIDVCAIYHREFTSGQFKPYVNFEIDAENSIIIVTTTNALFHLSLDLQQLTNNVSSLAEDDVYRFCMDEHVRREDECQNYQNVLIVPGDGGQVSTGGSLLNTSDIIITCGSNAFSPQCQYRNRFNLSLIDSVDGNLLNPYGPFQWIPSLWTSTGRLVVAAPQNGGLDSYGMVLSDIPFSGMTTVKTRTQNRWFYRAPDFVSIYETRNYIYLFFREEAVESKERVKYSRVARVCKNDMGILVEETTIFSTFIKARIICSNRSGNNIFIPYTYNNLHDTFYHKSEQRLYAIFQSAENGPLGSAVCMFRFGEESNDLDSVFSGSYLEEVREGLFETRPNYRPFTCDHGNRTRQESLDLQLMKPAVEQPASWSTPILQMEGMAFQKIAMDTADGNSILYITTIRKADDALLLLKVMVNVSGVTPIHQVLQTVVLPTKASSSLTVSKMYIHRSDTETYVYIGTQTDIFSVPLHDTTGPPNGINPTPSVLSPHATSSLVGIATTNTTKAPVNPTVSEYGLTGSLGNPKHNSWIIVGTVVGFVGGVFIGILLMFLFRQFVVLRGKKRNRYSMPHEIINDTKTSNFTAHHHHKNHKDPIGRHPKRNKIVCVKENEKVLHVNNNVHEYTCSNNLTQTESGRSTTPVKSPLSTPEGEKTLHVNTPTTPIKFSPSTPKGEKALHVNHVNTRAESDPPLTPVKSSLSTPEGAAATSSKFQPFKSVDNHAPGPLHSPSSSGSEYKSKMQEEKRFAFPPLSHHFSLTTSTPSYSNSVAGASAHSASQSWLRESITQYTPSSRDPNVKSSFRAEAHLTNQEREAYGRNILHRLPSFDGTKTKHSLNGGGPGSRSGERTLKSPSTTVPSSFSGESSLPRKNHKQQDFIQLDTELGSSHC